MKEAFGDLWDYHAQGWWAVIPTNCQHSRGRAHMGAGLARQAAWRYPELPARYAAALEQQKLNLELPEQRLILLPTKTVWRKAADPILITYGVLRLRRWADAQPEVPGEPLLVALPQLGCGLGQLEWAHVQPLLERQLDDRFTVLLPLP